MNRINRHIYWIQTYIYIHICRTSSCSSCYLLIATNVKWNSSYLILSYMWSNNFYISNHTTFWFMICLQYGSCYNYIIYIDKSVHISYVIVCLLLWQNINGVLIIYIRYWIPFITYVPVDRWIYYVTVLFIPCFYSILYAANCVTMASGEILKKGDTARGTKQLCNLA